MSSTLTLSATPPRAASVSVAETVEAHPEVLLDLNDDGNVVGIEIFSTSELAPALTVGVDARPGRAAAKLPISK